ncbi:MAG: SsrA-binding protein, partial [Candidatus Levybacteria bacterium]|nr:SsrA-binding protein [Candidatus Levybacteria bacterium]
ILALKSKLDQGKLTIVPLSIYLKDGNFKLELALVESKNKREKRRDRRQETIERVQERELRNY